MRIAFIVNRFPSLSQTFVLNQITGLIDQGHDVDIYAEGPSQSDNKVHKEVDEYALLSRTYYFGWPSNKLASSIKSCGIILSQSLKNVSFLRLTINHFNFSQEEALIPRLQFPYIAKEFFGKPEYDAIHCHFGPNGIRGALVKKLIFPNSILVTTFHGYDLTKVLFDGENPYINLFKIGDLFLPISEHWKHVVLKLGCPEERTKVHHMGVNLNQFSTDFQDGTNREKVRIVTVARLTEKKGVEYGIRAVEKLKRTCSDLRYIVVGDGELRESLQKLILELDLEEFVEIIGWRQQHEIASILSHSHILLAPSITALDGDKEGIPVVLMEAMAMGLPVVSTYHSGIPELVKDGVSGFLTVEKDVEATAEKLALLIESPELRLSFGDQGRKFIKKNFNIETLNFQLSALLEEQVAQRSQKAGNSYLHNI